MWEREISALAASLRPSLHRLMRGDNVTLRGQRVSWASIPASTERNPSLHTPLPNDRPRNEPTFDKALWDDRAKAKAPVEERNALHLAGRHISKLQESLARKERWCSVLPLRGHPDPFPQATRPKSPCPDRLRQSTRSRMTHDSTGRKSSPEIIPTLDPKPIATGGYLSQREGTVIMEDFSFTRI